MMVGCIEWRDLPAKMIDGICTPLNVESNRELDLKQLSFNYNFDVIPKLATSPNALHSAQPLQSLAMPFAVFFYEILPSFPSHMSPPRFRHLTT